MLHWIAFTVIGLFMAGSFLRANLSPGRGGSGSCSEGGGDTEAGSDTEGDGYTGGGGD